MATIPIVNTIDRRNGLIAATIVMIGVIAYLLIASIEMADPPPQDIKVEAATDLPEEIDLKDFIVEGGGASGSPVQDEVVKPQPQTQDVLTTDKPADASTPDGQSSHTNSNNPNNTSSTSQQSDNPFGPGGNDTGPGPSDSEFGPSTGPSNGPGPSGKKRVRLNDPDTSPIHSNEDARIAMVLTIDAEGNIVSISCNKSSTTTNNQNLINKVMALVKKQVKYNKDPGAALKKVALSVNIFAQ